jgi:signal transduction histidine kinase
MDLAVYDDRGELVCFAGKTRPSDGSQQAEDWFHQARHHGRSVSEVTRDSDERLSMILAIRYEGDDHRDRILRATLGVAELYAQLEIADPRATSDVFLINRSGVLQSPSERYGAALQSIRLPTPPRSGHTEVVEQRGQDGEPVLVGYVWIDDSPFTLMLVKPSRPATPGWLDPGVQLLLTLLFAAGLAAALVFLMARKLVRSFRDSDAARARFFHRMEFTNKLATVGRLAAGVAHEINNPLAIINQKAGLLDDRISLGSDFAGKDKALESTQALMRAVDRCTAITHRLLGFAKHMDVEMEPIDVEALLREVLGFLDKEASYRKVSIDWRVASGLPQVRSDRGQLQQVFLNLFNNAIAAVSDNGNLEIVIRRASDSALAVEVADDGVGIPEAHMKRIFEPFFTTKPGTGTGLGLAVSYGIIQKLGGVIRVESTPGVGTRFTVELPATPA